jgi:sugar phosphate isomerase/epimerase
MVDDVVRVNGVLPHVAEYDLAKLPWYYRTVGYGHDNLVWRSIMSTLRLEGYDHVVSIEHEDALMSIDEGVKRAVELMKSVIIREAPSEPWW